MFRTFFCFAALLVASPAGSGFNDYTICASGAPDASGCPTAEGEVLLTEFSLERYWDTPEPATLPQSFSAFAAPDDATGFGVPFTYAANKYGGVIPDAHGIFALSLIDGEPAVPGSWYFTVDTFGVSGWSPLESRVEPLLPVPLAFVSGQHGAFNVTSHVTLLNGIDLDGLGYHVSRLLIFIGDWSAEAVAGGYRNYVTVTLQLFGAPGEIPEPCSACLLCFCIPLISHRYYFR